MIYVVIPAYNDLSGLKGNVESIYNSTNQKFKLIILESESTDGTKEYCDLLPNLYPGKEIEIIHTRKEGPLKAYLTAFGLAIRDKADLYLTQTDVLHPKARFDWLYSYSKMAETWDMVTCWGGGGISGESILDGFQWVGAWSTYIPYRTLEKIGGYDESIPLGYAVDIEYSLRLWKAGLKTVIFDYWVEHFPNYEKNHEHEKREDLEEIKKQAFDYIKRKHGIHTDKSA